MGNWTRRFSLRWFGTILLLSTLTLLLGTASWMSYRVLRTTLWVDGLRNMDFQVMSTLGMVKGRVVSEISRQEFMSLIHGPVQVGSDWQHLSPALSAGIYQVQLIDADGRLLDSYPPGRPRIEVDPKLLAELQHRRPDSRFPARLSYEAPGNRQVLLMPLASGKQLVGFAVMSNSWFPSESFLTNVATASQVIVLFILGVILLVYLALVRQITGPLSAVTRCARRVTGGDLEARTGLAEGRNEIYLVGAAFDQMLERLQTLFQRQKNFVSDVSHELRTPLTALTGQLHILESLSSDDDPPRRRQALARAERDLDRMVALVEDLLTLMRSEDAPLEHEQLQLAEWVGDAVDRTHALYSDRVIEVQSSPPTTLWGEREALSRALTNVLINACKYTPAGSAVELRSRLEGDTLLLEVQDHGPGLPPEALSQLGQRFFRPDPSRSRQTGGSGLGLAIARATLLRHDGQLEVESRLGEGTRVIFRLPHTNNQQKGHAGESALP